MSAFYKKHMGFGYWLVGAFNKERTQIRVWWSDRRDSEKVCPIEPDGTFSFGGNQISIDGFYREAQ